jgi:hypothetical protein
VSGGESRNGDRQDTLIPPPPEESEVPGPWALLHQTNDRVEKLLEAQLRRDTMLDEMRREHKAMLDTQNRLFDTLQTVGSRVKVSLDAGVKLEEQVFRLTVSHGIEPSVEKGVKGSGLRGAVYDLRQDVREQDEAALAHRLALDKQVAALETSMWAGAAAYDRLSQFVHAAIGQGPNPEAKDGTPERRGWGLRAAVHRLTEHMNHQVRGQSFAAAGGAAGVVAIIETLRAIFH